MASEITRFSRDGNWKVEIEAWLNNFFFYSSIGTQVTVYRKSGSSIWGGSSWSEAPARTITIQNLYNGGLAYDEGRWVDASYAELKQWAVGFQIKVPPRRPPRSDGLVPPRSDWLILDSVEGVVQVILQNGEAFNERVNASDVFTDSSIW